MYFYRISIYFWIASGISFFDSFLCFQPMGSRKDLSCQGVRGLVNWKSLYNISGLLTFQTNSVRHQNITDHMKENKIESTVKRLERESEKQNKTISTDGWRPIKTLPSGVKHCQPSSLLLCLCQSCSCAPPSPPAPPPIQPLSLLSPGEPGETLPSNS